MRLNHYYSGAENGGWHELCLKVIGKAMEARAGMDDDDAEGHGKRECRVITSGGTGPQAAERDD